MASITIINSKSDQQQPGTSLIQSSAKSKNHQRPPTLYHHLSQHHNHQQQQQQQQLQPEQGSFSSPSSPSSSTGLDGHHGHEASIPSSHNVTKSGLITLISTKRTVPSTINVEPKIRSSKRLKSKHSRMMSLDGPNGLDSPAPTDLTNVKSNLNDQGGGYQVEFHEVEDELDPDDEEDELVSFIETDKSNFQMNSPDVIPDSVEMVEDDDDEPLEDNVEEDLEASTEDSSPLIEESPPLMNPDADEDGNTPNRIEEAIPLITPKMEGQSWSKIIFARNNHHNNNNSTSIKDSESSSSPASFTEWNRRHRQGLNGKDNTESEIMTLKREDMAIYGICPARDRFFVTNCDVCGQVVKYQALAQHIELRHGNNNNNGHNNAILPNIETPPPSTRSEASSSSSESFSNPDNHDVDSGNREPVNGLTIPVIKIKTGSATSPPRLISPKTYSVRGQSPIDDAGRKSSNNQSDNNLKSTDAKSDVARLSPLPGVPNGVGANSNTRLKLMLSSPSVTISKTSPALSGTQSSLPSSPSCSPIPDSKGKSESGSQESNRSSKSSKSNGARPASPMSILKEKLLPCKHRQYCPDKHCGVKTEVMTKECTRSLTCKSHSLTLRRQVLGRSEPFDQLLERHRIEKEEALRALGKEIKPTKKQIKAREVEARKAAAAQAKLVLGAQVGGTITSASSSAGGSRPPSRPPSRPSSSVQIISSTPASPASVEGLPPKITITTTTTTNNSSKSSSRRSSSSSNTIIINSSKGEIVEKKVANSSKLSTTIGSGTTLINSVQVSSSAIRSGTPTPTMKNNGGNLMEDSSGTITLSNHNLKEFTKIQINPESGMTIINSNLPDTLSVKASGLSSKSLAAGISAKAAGLSSKSLSSKNSSLNCKTFGAKSRKRQLSSDSSSRDVTVSLISAPSTSSQASAKPDSKLNQLLSGSINDSSLFNSNSLLSTIIAPDVPDRLIGPVIIKSSRSDYSAIGSTIDSSATHCPPLKVFQCEETGMSYIESRPQPISINNYNCRYLNLNLSNRRNPDSLLDNKGTFKIEKSKISKKINCTGSNNHNSFAPISNASLFNNPINGSTSIIATGSTFSPLKSYPDNFVACSVYNRRTDFTYSKLRPLFESPSSGNSPTKPKNVSSGQSSKNGPQGLNSASFDRPTPSGKRIKKEPAPLPVD